MNSNSPSNLPDLTHLDPAVSAVLRTGQSAASDRSLPKKDQARKAKERRKTAARTRIMVDIDPGLQTDLTRLAVKFDLPVSSLVNFAVMLMVIDYVGGELVLPEFIQPSQSRNGKSTLCLYRDTPIIKSLKP